jgi:hypothetical protein
MNPSVKKLWVDALRSGEYEQCTGILRDSFNRFCCLGVLCNLHAMAHPQIAASQKSAAFYMGQDTDVPNTVRDWAGLKEPEGEEVFVGKVKTSLARHNDGGATFAQIADAIEGQL